MQPMMRPPEREDRIDVRIEESPRSGMAAVLVLIAVVATLIVVLAIAGGGESSEDGVLPTEPPVTEPVPSDPDPTIVP
jgi:hypothetical protein